MKKNTHGSNCFYFHLKTVDAIEYDLIYSDHKKKKYPRSAPIEEDDEERIIMEFNNYYTFEL